MSKLNKNLYAFTLAELATSVTILLVIIALALPRYSVVLEKSNSDEGRTILLSLLAAQERFAMEHDGNYTTNLSALDIDLRPSANFSSAQALDPTASSGNVAQITRTGSYTLRINRNGQFSCTGGAGGLCTQLGF